MARRTPPVQNQVVDPIWANSPAYYKKRLIDFDTGSAALEGQHIDWLTNTMQKVTKNSESHTFIFGFASKLGSAAANNALARNRMNSTFNFMQRFDSRVMSSLQQWLDVGSQADDYAGAADDNSAEWRAVEVHILIGELPGTVKPPPRFTPIPRTVPPLPGGPRYKKWAVAAPGGASVTVWVGGGFNIFVIKNVETTEMRAYIQIAAAAGWSFGLSKLKGIWAIVQGVVTSVSGTNMDFTDVTTAHGVTWDEMESCLVTVSQAGAGLIIGGAAANVKFDCPKLYVYGASGFPLTTHEELFNFNSTGRDWQLGAGVSVLTGPIFKVG